MFAHALFLGHAGALWRDEANTVAFAELPSLAAVVASLRYDSVPLALTMLVRASLRARLGSDAALRWLGFSIGCATLGTLWWNARRNHIALPICTILLFAFNLWVIRGGDAIRPAGLGMLSIVLTFATLGAALQQPRAWRIALAAVCAVLAAQSIYSNLPLVLAVCLAGVAVGVYTRSRTRIAIGVGIGAVAGLSLIPYLPAIRAAREWSMLVQSRLDLAQLWAALAGTDFLDGPGWALLAIAGLALAGMRLASGGAAPVGAGDRERALYAATTLVAGSVGFLLLVVWSGLPTQPWYYLPLIALSAACLDLLLGDILRAPRAGLAIATALIAATVAHLVVLAPSLHLRQTNLDLVAARIGATATRDDLIIVSPWYYGITFHRYYTGAAPWLTVPPLGDVTVHRYDLLKQQMRDPAAVLDAAIERSIHTLQGGGRIWLVGALMKVTDGTIPQPPPAAPADLGWSIDAYTNRWSQLLAAVFLDHVVSVEQVDVPTPDRVVPFEDVPVMVLQGWQ